MTESGQGPAGNPPQPGGQMMLMLLMMLFMMMLIMNPGIREALKTYADPILTPIVPENSLILMVFILGSASMVVNTILRSFFMDPVAQAHIAHRQRQIGKMANEARMDHDKVAQDAAMRMREMMMPDQMAVQMGAFKPMMFTMVFIIAIFAWLAETVTNFRVEYLSLPWAVKWPLNDRVDLPCLDIRLHLHVRAIGQDHRQTHQVGSLFQTSDSRCRQDDPRTIARPVPPAAEERGETQF